jgi:hypothetical protein
VELLGRYSHHADQGERLRHLLEIVPEQPKKPKARTAKRVCRKLIDEQIEVLVAGYAQGIRCVDLAASFGINEWTAQKYVRLAGLPRRAPRLGPRQIEEAIRLYSQGSSLMVLGKRFSVSAETVRSALMRAGVELRARRGWRYRT